MIKTNMATDPDYIKRSYFFAQLSRMAYWNRIGDGKPSVRLYLENAGFKNIFFIENRLSDTQAIIATSESLQVLAIRGTTNGDDWKTNLNMYPTLMDKANASKKGTRAAMKGEDFGLVHYGFYWAVHSIMKEIEFHVDITRPVYCAGHSLGGADATVAAAMLVNRAYNVAGVYTYGAPRVGKMKFKKWYDSRLADKSFHFVNESDIVPHVPAWLGFWRHVDNHYFINTKNEITPGMVRLLSPRRMFKRRGNGYDAINDHYIPEYLEALKAKIK